MKPIACFIVAAALGGCGPDNPVVAVPTLDHELFVGGVEAMLERRCAVPSCHGNARRPLSIYAPDRYRMDPSRVRLVEPLSAAELAANERSTSAFALGITSAAQSLLVTKSLGSVYHQGGVLWTSVDEPECQTLLTWLRSGGLP